MDAVKFLKEIKRLCKQQEHCNKCPLYGKCSETDTQQDSDSDNINELVRAVEEWSAEHPQKTRLMDLLEKFPKFSMGTDNLPMVLPRLFGYCDRGRCQGCEHQNEEESCWNLPLEE